MTAIYMILGVLVATGLICFYSALCTSADWLDQDDNPVPRKNKKERNK